MSADLGLFGSGLFTPDTAATPSDEVTAPPLELPEPFASAEVSAFMEYGRRILCWTLAEPGQLYRNRYDTAWVQVTEYELWQDGPLHLRATRRAGDSYERTSFADHACQALSAQLLPLIAGYGFSRLWLAHYYSGRDATHARRDAEEARRHAQWHDMRADLVEMQQAGCLDFVAVARDRDRSLRQLVLDGAGRFDREEPAAEALTGGRHVGWITTRGQLIPDGDILENRPKTTER